MVEQLLKFTHDTNDFTSTIILKNELQIIFKVQSKQNGKFYYANQFTTQNIPDPIQCIIKSGLIDDLRDFFVALLSIKNTFTFNEELSILEVTLSFCHKMSVMEIPVYKDLHIDGEVKVISSSPDHVGIVPEEIDEVKNEIKKNNGEKYYGKFNNDQGHYEGEMFKNLMHGKGNFYFKNGDFYTGDFLDGYKNGYGQFTYEDGEKYQGNFISNYMYGKGSYYMKDGSICESFYKLSLASGPGIQKSPQGDITFGTYVDGMLQGNLVIFYKNGDILEQPTEGFAKYYFKNGEIFEGYFIDGLKEGFGTSYWADNVKEQGNYLNDFKHGEFKMIFSDGTIQKTYWFKGVNCSQGEFKQQTVFESASPAPPVIEQVPQEQDPQKYQNPCPKGF